MLSDIIKEMTLACSPRFIPEIKLHSIIPAKFKYPFTPDDYNCMYGYPTWSGIALARFILDNPEKFAGKNITDIGCGSGIASIAAAKVGANVTAIDRDLTALYFTEQNCILNDVSVNLVWGTFDDIKTDHVMFSSVLYEKKNLNAMIALSAEGKTNLIGSASLEFPDEFSEKLTKIRVNTEMELYVFSNFVGGGT